jgi:xanthine dehydrogenase molybdopterin-binding subunit B
MSQRNQPSFLIKFKSQDIPLQFDTSATIADLQEKIYLHTKVPVEGQKLLGLGSNKAATRHAANLRLVDIAGLKPNQKVVLLGVPIDESVIIVRCDECHRCITGNHAARNRSNTQ